MRRLQPKDWEKQKQTGKREKRARGPVLMRLFGSGPMKFSPPSAAPPKLCSPAQRGGRSIIWAERKKGGEWEGGEEIKRMSWCLERGAQVACCLSFSIYSGNRRKCDYSDHYVAQKNKMTGQGLYFFLPKVYDRPLFFKAGWQVAFKVGELDSFYTTVCNYNINQRSS